MAASVLIIGGGPAGAVAACRLRDHGHAVTVVEAARFPRDKVCGECLSALGLATLDAAGLDKTFGELRPNELIHTRIVSRRGRTFETDLPKPMAGVTRKRMDAALLDAAAERGATILQPTKATLAETGVFVRDVDTDKTTLHQPDVIVLADGKSNFGDRPKPTGDFGLKVHFTGVDLPTDTIALLGLRGHYVGIAPVAGDGGKLLWNLAFNVPARKLKPFGQDHDALLAACCEESRPLGDALRNAKRVGEWQACALPRFSVRRDWPANVVPVGNAAAALEPVGGEGMGLAMRSALLAADAIAAGDVSNLPSEFHNLWSTRRTACRTIAVALGSPLGGLAVTAANALPPVAKLAMRLMGKASATPADGNPIVQPPAATVS